MPSIPYVSVVDFHTLMNEGVTATAEQGDDGTWTITTPDGSATINTDAETFSSDDLYAFLGTTRMGTADADLGIPCVKPSNFEAEPANASVTHDFSGFDIDLRSDSDGVYLPFTIAADLYNNDDTAHRAAFNGEKVYVNNRPMLMSMLQIDPEYTAPVLAQATRSEDLATYSFAEWSYVMQHLYGYPGSAPIDETILREQGLEAALKAQGIVGEKCAELLKSQDVGEYLVGTSILNTLFNDGHCTLALNGLNQVTSETAPEIFDAFVKAQGEVGADQELMAAFQEISAASYAKMPNDSGREAQRKASIGESHINKKGDTLLISFDSFHEEHDAWKEFYASEGHDLDAMLSSEAADKDSVLIFLNAMREAESDPNIKNVVIDLTNNAGGDSTVLLTIQSLIMNKSELTFEDTLTGQHITLSYDVDRNFDGVFDEKDDEVSYDYNFAALTSAKSFSCGNELPSMMKDAGMPVLGEQSSGGSCMIASLTSAEGYDYVISGYRARLTNAAGENINSGIPVDVDLLQKEADGSVKMTDVKIMALTATGEEEEQTHTMADYSQFWDLDVLSNAVNEFYAAADTTAEAA